MENQLEGVIREMLPVQEGEGRNGRWRKQSFILELPGNFPKQVCIMVWGDRIDQFNLKVGDEIVASIDLESREYNGRWYTDVKAWKVEKKAPAAPAPPADESEGEPFPGSPDSVQASNGNDAFGAGPEDDDLPF